MKKLISIILSILLIFSFSTLSFADTDPTLTSRNDFNWGVCIHTPEINGSAYNPIHLDWQLKMAAEMGVKLIRTGISNNISHTDRTVKMANSYGIKVMLVIPIPEKTFGTDYNLNNIKEYYKTQVSRYDGTKGFGKADFIQIDNELDNILMGRFGVETDGTKISNYNINDLKNITAQIKAATEGIKVSGNNVKTVINFSWKHYGMLDYFYQNGVEWDIIGHDWYSNMMYAEESAGKTPYEIGDTLYKKFGKEIIICETNAYGDSFDFDETNTSGWDILIRAMEDYYSRDYVIGAVFYELSDEIGRQGEDAYNPEAHYGLLFTDEQGNLIEPKPIYYRIQNIIGGGPVEKSEYCIPDTKYQNTLITEKKGYLGGTAIPQNKDSYWGYKGLIMFSDTDTSEADFIELDIYASADTNCLPNLVLSNNGDNPSSKSGFKIPKLKSGWNHVVLDYNAATDGHSLNKSAVDTMFWGGIFSTEKEISITVANLGFTTTTPELLYRGVLYSEFDGYNNVTVPSGADILGISPIALPTPANLNVTGFVHLNIYASNNCEALLNFNSTPARIQKPDAIASAYKQVTLKKGWNNIGIRTTDLVNLNGWNANKRFNAQSITYIYFSGVLSQSADVIMDMGSLVFTASGLSNDIQKGDYNADTKIDILDLVFVKNESINLSFNWFPNIAELDGCKDSQINSADFTAMRKFIFSAF